MQQAVLVGRPVLPGQPCVLAFRKVMLVNREVAGEWFQLCPCHSPRRVTHRLGNRPVGPVTVAPTAELLGQPSRTLLRVRQAACGFLEPSEGILHKTGSEGCLKAF